MRSKRLNRQIKKSFGDEAIEESLKTLLAALPDSVAEKAALAQFAEGLPEFLNQVQETYDQTEEKVVMAQRSVEISNSELTEVNSSLFSLNKTFQAMINSLGQGFFLFGADGICLPVYTKACETLLEKVPSGLPASQVLGVPDEKAEYFLRWIDLMFREVIEFSEIAAAGPSSYAHSKDLSVAIEYKPVRDHDGHVELIVAIVTDRTSEVRAKREANEMQAFAVLVSSIIRDRERFRRYVDSARAILHDTWIMIDRDFLQEQDLQVIKRQLHTLKGVSGSFGMLRVKDSAHLLESKIAEIVDRRLVHAELIKGLPEITQLFESILTMHADVIGDTLKSKDPMREVPLPVLLDFDATLKDLGFSAEPARTKFQNNVLTVPVEKVFSHFNVTLQEAAVALNKKIAPIMIGGGELRVHPERMESLVASLVHVFRNIADHGIETPSTRLANGKGAQGFVRIDFDAILVKTVSHLRIRITDDGAGINVSAIRSRLLSRGEKVEEASDADLMKRIFDGGVSTADKVTEYSGRGIGMSAVKSDVEALGGTITVESKRGAGTTFTLLFPCEFAIGFQTTQVPFAA